MYYMGCVKITSLATLLSMRLCLQVVLRHVGDIAASRALHFSRTQPNKRRARCSWYRGEAKLQQASSAVQLSGDASSCRLHRASDRRGAKYSQPQHTQEGGL